MTIVTESRGFVMDSVGQRVKNLRDSVGWSQADLAEKAGLDASYISLLERGKRPNPGLDAVQRIAHALGTSMAYLVGETDDPRPPSKAEAAAPNREEGLKDGDPVPPDLQLYIERAMFRSLEKWDRMQRKDKPTDESDN